ncbi:probable pathogenesis-related protein ARB_02861 isoform X1 [Drosophila teissieri]|uniref:probable pathogenesis-related protein ARB_02861 isoform X1 n=1 Tax=Drosophila teissieri TaxID=7243 RepID=UPI001CBA34C5|nr:probable pathogenesis-related protein ARB_02861 isoform X1 [Drosophila teissieri]
MVYIYFDIWFPITMVLLIVILLLVLLRVRRARQLRMGNATVVTAAPVVVTSATHTAPGGYPVTQLPPPGYPAGNAYVTSASYPAQTTSNVTVQMPMPMPHQNQQQMPMPMPGMQTHGVAYPPYPGAGAASMNPPPYDMAMANPGPSVMPAGYEKQAPYNPHFGQ